MKRYIFPEPLDAECKLQPDSLPAPIQGQADIHPANGAPCQSFEVPATVPNKNGAALTITKKGFAPIILHGILDTITVGAGGFECDVFTLQKATGGVRPFVLDGHFCRHADDGSELLINESTGFRWFNDFIFNITRADAFGESLAANHFNMARVTALQDTTLYLPQVELQYRIHPADHSDFYDQVVSFTDYAAGFGCYLDWICCTQTQTIMPDKNAQLRHVQSMFDALHDRYCFISKVNENYVHDNTIEDAVRLLPKPTGAKFLLSTGSKGAGDETPIPPVADLIEYHSNDLSEWQRKAHNAWEMGNHNNGAGYTSESTRTDKDPSLIHFEDAGKTQAAMTLACILHSPEGKNADPFSFSLPFIDAHNRGVFAVPIEQRRGPYDRYPNPAVLRDYSMGTFRWQVRNGSS